jgi:nitrogen PTS system EIIA component
MINITNYLDTKLIHFFDSKNSADMINDLVGLLDKHNKLQNKEAFLEALFERERIVSTGIGMGVAIPHAKLPNYKDFFIAIGIQRQGIDWKSLDDLPVQLIFMIGGPDNKQTPYLQILSQITTILKDESTRKNIVNATSPEEVIQIFRES